MLAFFAALFGIFMFMFAIKCPFVRRVNESVNEGIDKSPSSSGFSELVTELVRKSE